MLRSSRVVVALLAGVCAPLSAEVLYSVTDTGVSGRFGVAAEGLITAPRGARLPNNTATPPLSTLGIYMAFKYNRDRRLVWGLLLGRNRAPDGYRRGDLIFLASAQEEIWGVGAKHWLDTSGYKPDLFVAADLPGTWVWYGAVRSDWFKFFYTRRERTRWKAGRVAVRDRQVPAPA